MYFYHSQLAQLQVWHVAFWRNLEDRETRRSDLLGKLRSARFVLASHHIVTKMSLPDIFPKKSTAGIVVEPNTLTRIVPESRRPDGRCG